MIVIGNYKTKHNNIIKILVITLLIVAIPISFLLFSIYKNKLSHLLEEEAKITLQNISAQNIISLNNNLSMKQNFLKSIVEAIEYDKNLDIVNIVEKLKLYAEPNGFYDIGIIDQTGNCYTTLNEVLNLSKEEYFIQGMKGISGVYKAIFNKESENLLNIYVEPIYLDGEVKFLLIATQLSSEFSNLINISSFDGNGSSMVVDCCGNLVSLDIPMETLDPSTINNKDKEKYNILKVIEESSSHITDPTKKDELFIDFQYDNEEYLAYYEPIGVNNWCLISYVPKSYIYHNLNEINGIVADVMWLMYALTLLFVGLFIMEYIRYEKKVTSLVFYDDLTKEKNYEYLKLNFKYLSNESKRKKFLVAMDVDKFKNINIMHGSEVGDKLLLYINSIFKELLPKDELYRCKGDLFVCIINGTSQDEIRNKIILLENRIKEDIEKNLLLPIKLSFGVCSLEEFEDLNSIFNNALISKNEIKAHINDKIKFFNRESKETFIEHRILEAKFHDSLANNEFEVWYQPKYKMNTGEIYGAEALIRWREKNGHLISPASFIPVFENSGQILELDEKIIELTFKNIQEMKELGLDIKPISINLSRVHVDQFGIVNKIKDLMKKYEINPRDVSFEITESALIEDNTLICELTSQLHELGFQVDIDDYGTGNSTLNALYSSDFNTLKLDKSFIDNIGDPKMDVIIRSTIAMAKELNMKIVAEGVETKEQISFLLENNCTIGQGYYFSKPVDKTTYYNLLKKST